jgi:hypothetical protein
MSLSQNFEPHYLIALHFTPATAPDWHTVAITAALPQELFLGLLADVAALPLVDEISRGEQGAGFVATLKIAANWKLDDQVVQAWSLEDVTQFNEETQMDEVIQVKVLSETTIDGVKTRSGRSLN